MPDPNGLLFELAKRIEQKLEPIFAMTNHRVSPQPKEPISQSPTRKEKQTLSAIAKIFGTQLQKGPLMDSIDLDILKGKSE